MKLSIEAKVAAAIAVAFAALSIGAIAQEQSERDATKYGPTSSPGLSHMTARQFNSSLSGPQGESEVLGPY
jgi:hypothetical protein